MAVEYVKVTEFVRGVVNGRVVVRRPGARIPLDLAVALGLEPAPAAPVARTARQHSPSVPSKPPRRPAGATPPKARKTGRR